MASSSTIQRRSAETSFSSSMQQTAGATTSTNSDTREGGAIATTSSGSDRRRFTAIGVIGGRQRPSDDGIRVNRDSDRLTGARRQLASASA